MGQQQRSATVLIRGEETSGRFALVETIERPANELPVHRHHWADTMIYVLEGVLAIAIGGTWVRVPAGTAVFLPRGVEHAYAVTSDTARVLTMLTPAGFERFYLDIDAATSRGDTATLEQVVALAARYGCEITGPHPGRPPPAGAVGVVEPTKADQSPADIARTAGPPSPRSFEDRR